MNRRTFLGIIPAAAGISTLAASAAPAPAKWPLVIPVVESLEEAPPSGPAILVQTMTGGVEYFTPIFNRKRLWIITGGNPGALSTSCAHFGLAHNLLVRYLRNEVRFKVRQPPSGFVWATTQYEAEFEAGRVLGGK